MKITYETVRRVGLTLPDVEEGTSYGSPALMVHGKMFACVPTNKSAEPGSLVVRWRVILRAAARAWCANITTPLAAILPFDF